MSRKVIYEGKSLKEAAEAVANSLREADRQREEWLASQHKSTNQSVTQQGSVPPNNK